MHNVAIVIPTIRETSIKTFLSVWENEFKKHHVIIVEDNPTKTFNLPPWVDHYSWEEIDRELGSDAWIISRRSAAIRSFGFLKAWQKKTKYVFTTDDDCLPEERFRNGGFLTEIVQRLETKWEADQWWDTLHGSIYQRGYPYSIRKQKQQTVMHHGMWSNIPDIDGKTQKKYPSFRTRPFTKVEKIPFGRFFPMSAANLAFRRELVPALYFLLMGQDNKGNKWPYERFDDVWAGLFCKRICDHLGWSISSGSPSVNHGRASNVDVNIEKEKAAMPVNEWLWEEVMRSGLNADSVLGCYKESALYIGRLGGYWKTLSKAMRIWISLFT